MIKLIGLILVAIFHKYIGPMEGMMLFMSWVSVTYSFSPSTTIKSSEVNQNFTDLVNAIEKAMPSNANGHGIIMWSGAVANVPSGWYICDGSNGTPDLRGRFVIGAGGAYSVGATGGASSVTLTTNELPSHGHTGTTGTESSVHYHDTLIPRTNDTNQSSTSEGYLFNGDDSTTANVTPKSSGTESALHTHNFSTSSTGSGASFSILNPYHSLCFIMKS